MKIANSTSRATNWLSLVAAPTFALMAALTSVADHGTPEALCSAMSHTSALSGMVPMYVLMSAFHLAPWLKLIAGWRSGGRAAGTHEGGVARPFVPSLSARSSSGQGCF